MLEDHSYRAVGESNWAIRKQHLRCRVTQISQTDEDFIALSLEP